MVSTMGLIDSTLEQLLVVFFLTRCCFLLVDGESMLTPRLPPRCERHNRAEEGKDQQVGRAYDEKQHGRDDEGRNQRNKGKSWGGWSGLPGRC